MAEPSWQDDFPEARSRLIRCLEKLHDAKDPLLLEIGQWIESVSEIDESCQAYTRASEGIWVALSEISSGPVSYQGLAAPTWHEVLGLEAVRMINVMKAFTHGTMSVTAENREELANWLRNWPYDRREWAILKAGLKYEWRKLVLPDRGDGGHEPLAKLLAHLTPLASTLLTYLSTNSPATFDNLIKNCWKNPVQEPTVRRALERLRNCLLEINPAFDLKITSSATYLVRP